MKLMNIFSVVLATQMAVVCPAKVANIVGIVQKTAEVVVFVDDKNI